MSRLLKANFVRVFRDKIFYICVVGMILFGSILPITHYLDMIKYDTDWPLERTFFVFTVIVAILVAIFTSLFIGTEYSDGTMRNKLVVGQKRGTIYLSNYISSTIAGFIMCAAFVIPYVAIGTPLLGFFSYGVLVSILLILSAFIMTAAFVSLFTFIAMLCQNKAYTAVCCMILSLLLLFAGTYINSSLNEEETYQGYSYSINGMYFNEEESPNPNYISGTKRDIYEFLYDFIPGGQAVQLYDMSADNPGLLMLYDLIIIVIFTGGGIVLFKKEDLK